MKNKNLVLAIVTTLLSTEVTLSAMAHNAATPPGMEKCYGVAKSRSNECGTKTHICATLSKKDRDPESWIFLPKGTCDKIAGGSTSPEDEQK